MSKNINLPTVDDIVWVVENYSSCLTVNDILCGRSFGTKIAAQWDCENNPRNQLAMHWACIGILEIRRLAGGQVIYRIASDVERRSSKHKEVK